MRKIALVLVLIASTPVVGGTVACNSTWWQDFQKNPVEQVQVFESGVHTALSAAQVAWAFVQSYLPAASAAAITQQYQNAVFAVNHALTVLDDAVSAALDAQQSNPDFSKLMTAVADAVAQVIAIVDQYKGVVPPDGGAIVALGVNLATPTATSPMTVPGLEDARAQLVQLKKLAQH